MKIWCSNKIDNNTKIDSTNSEFNITYNGQIYNLSIEEASYMVQVSTHESRLVDKINELFEKDSIGVKCLMGIKSHGIEKEAYIVFEVGETDTFDISGSFVDVIGVVE